MEKIKNIYEMNEEQLTECYNEVIAKHEEARTAYKKATTDEERKALKTEYPDYEVGHMPKTPARIAFEDFTQHNKEYRDLSSRSLVAKIEKVILQSPDAPEYCYHLASCRDEPWPEGEARIAESAWFSYRYAAVVLNSRFPAGEASIKTSDYYSARYERFYS